MAIKQYSLALPSGKLAEITLHGPGEHSESIKELLRQLPKGWGMVNLRNAPEGKKLIADLAQHYKMTLDKMRAKLYG